MTQPETDNQTGWQFPFQLPLPGLGPVGERLPFPFKRGLYQTVSEPPQLSDDPMDPFSVHPLFQHAPVSQGEFWNVVGNLYGMIEELRGCFITAAPESIVPEQERAIALRDALTNAAELERQNKILIDNLVPVTARMLRCAQHHAPDLSALPEEQKASYLDHARKHVMSLLTR